MSFHLAVKRASLLGIIMVGLSVETGCSSSHRGSASHATSAGRHYDKDSFWLGDKMSGSPSIVIKLGEQRAYFYKGDQLAGVSVISSGREGHDTVTGNFRIEQMDKDHRSSLYGFYRNADDEIIQRDVDTTKDPMPPGAHFDGARMPHFMRIVGGTGLHEGYLPGYPDSHGCIRLPGWIAEAFFEAASVGTPVTVRL